MMMLALATGGRPCPPSSPPRHLLDPLSPNNNPFQSPFYSTNKKKTTTTTTTSMYPAAGMAASSSSSFSAPFSSSSSSVMGSSSSSSIGIGGGISFNGSSQTKTQHNNNNNSKGGQGTRIHPWIAHFPGPAPISSVQPRKRFNYHEIVPTGDELTTIPQYNSTLHDLFLFVWWMLLHTYTPFSPPFCLCSLLFLVPFSIFRTYIFHS